MVIKSIFILSLLMVKFHPVHVGLTTVEIDEDSKKLNILIKLDKESLNYAFLHNYLYDLKFSKEVLDEKEINFINDYINNKFLLKINSVEAKLRFNRHEVVENEISFFYDADILTSVDSILVRNLLLFDININQTNVVIIKSSTFEKGFLLNKDQSFVKIKMTDN